MLPLRSGGVAMSRRYQLMEHVDRSREVIASETTARQRGGGSDLADMGVAGGKS